MALTIKLLFGCVPDTWVGLVWPGGPWHTLKMKWLDLPPLWLLLCVFLTFLVADVSAFGLSLDGPIWSVIGAVLVGAGVALMGLAVFEMRRHKTTVIPHQEADVLVRSGIFAHTRNPIYLGDVLVLAGLILRWDAPLALLLVPALAWVLQRRFILPEEERLRAKFGEAFDAYTAQTRRWM